MLYVLILITIMGFVTAAYVNLAGAAYKTEVAREREYAANCALEAGLLAMTDDYYNGKVTVASTPTYTPAAGSVSVSMIDNTANVTRTVAATASITYQSKKYRLTRVLGKRYANPVPNTYALFQNGNLNLNPNIGITTQSSILGGSVYVKGNITSAGYLTTAGDLESVGSVNGVPTVSGRQFPSSTSVNFPGINLNNYNGLGSILLILFALTGINLGSNYSTGHFASGGTMQISGTIIGQGSVAGGSLDITGDFTYFDGNAVAAFIMTNKITVESSAKNIAGYYYCTGTFTTNGPVTLNGSLACSDMKLGGPLTINYDSRIWTNESLATLLRLPGAYP